MHEADSPDEWFSLARSEADAARLMMISEMHRHAVQHAGFAIECVPKGRIMREQRLNSWPTSSKDSYRTHDLAALARYAGVAADLEAAVSEGDEEIGIVWLVAKDWSPSLRYVPDDAFPFARASDMMRSLLPGGLLEWLMR